MGGGRADEIDWSSFSFQHGFRLLQFRPLPAAAPLPEQPAKPGAEQVKQEEHGPGVKAEPVNSDVSAADPAEAAAAAVKAEVKDEAAPTGGVPSGPVPGLAAAATPSAAPLGANAALLQ